MVIVRGDVAAVPAESVTFTVKDDAPDAVGVPETELPDRLIPAGRVPAPMLHTYGGLPPVAAKEVAVYTTPTSPTGIVPAVIARGGTVGAELGRTVGVLLGVGFGDVCGAVVADAEALGDALAAGDSMGGVVAVGLGTLASGTRPHAASSKAKDAAAIQTLFTT